MSASPSSDASFQEFVASATAATAKLKSAGSMMGLETFGLLIAAIACVVVLFLMASASLIHVSPGTRVIVYKWARVSSESDASTSSASSSSVSDTEAAPLTSGGEPDIKDNPKPPASSRGSSPSPQPRYIRVLEPGLHVVSPLWSRWRPVPFEGLGGRHDWSFSSTCAPAPGSRFLVDPPACEVRSSDGVPGTANVRFEAVVTPWTLSDVLGVHVRFVSTAITLCNQWVGRELAGLTAVQLSDYATVTARLNDPAALTRLNSELISIAKLRALRVAVDACGIQMHKAYSDGVTRELAARFQMRTATVEAEALLDKTRRQAAADLLLAESRRTLAKLEAETAAATDEARNRVFVDRAKLLLEAGLTPRDVADLLCAETATAAVAKAQHVTVALPPSAIGLGWRRMGVRAAGEEPEFHQV